MARRLTEKDAAEWHTHTAFAGEKVREFLNTTSQKYERRKKNRDKSSRLFHAVSSRLARPDGRKRARKKKPNKHKTATDIQKTSEKKYSQENDRRRF